MRVLSIDDVPLGAPLGQSLYNDRGDVLVAAGVTLDTSLLSAIQSRGYRAVFVEDKQSEGIPIVDPLSPETRNRATKASADTLLAGSQTAIQLGPDFIARNRALPRSDTIRKIVQESVPVEAVYASSSSIVDEVLDAPTQLGLTSIKSQDAF